VLPADDRSALASLAGMRIAVVDSFNLFAYALCELLENLGAEVVDLGWSESALISILECGGSTVVVDVDVASGSAFDIVRSARSRGVQTPVLGLATEQSALVRKRAIFAGFQAILTRTQTIPVTSHALASVCRGEIDFVKDVLDPSESSPSSLLTPRERDVLSELINGSSTRELANSLGISEFTARTYVQRVLVKLGVHSRSEAVISAVTGGFNRVPTSQLLLAELESSGSSRAI
jgi:two-component system, NarL family, nitrate/nitrite response regulator NarL